LLFSHDIWGRLLASVANERLGDPPPNVHPWAFSQWSETRMEDSLQCFNSWLGDRKGIRPVQSWVLVYWWWWCDWSFDVL